MATKKPSKLEMARRVVYRDVPGFPGYRIGDDGGVWSRWSCWGPNGARPPTLIADWHLVTPWFSDGHRWVHFSGDRKRCGYDIRHDLLMKEVFG